MAKGVYEDLPGQRFGRLVAIKFAGTKPSGNRQKTMWLCKCDCGNEKEVCAGQLKNGTTTSCGCYHKEIVGALNRKHMGINDGRLYPLWKSIKYRCCCETCKDYPNYGGRGITICDEWKNNYASFREWALENGYKEEKSSGGRNILTIDRIDVNGNYEPSNCRFVPEIVQAYNKRNTLRIDYKGQKLTIKDISEMSGLSRDVVYGRIRYRGYTVDEVLSTPLGGRRRR